MEMYKAFNTKFSYLEWMFLKIGVPKLIFDQGEVVVCLIPNFMGPGIC